MNDAADLPEDHPALGLFQILREDGSTDPRLDPLLDEARLLEMYRRMMQSRLLDERMLMRQRQGRIGFYGTTTGQEAVPIGVAFATERTDWVFPALREAAIMLCRGLSLNTWLAQVYANQGDLLKGRQMPSHMSAREVNQVAWSSNIGTQLPHAVGAALAARLRGDGHVVVGFLGDGATSEPDFHAAMTFASRYKPPVILICQNNHWSISVPTSKQTASRTLAVKALAYGLPAERVDGNDVLGVYSATRRAVDRARNGDGPTFVECVTYRIGPHSSSDDPSLYRSDAEVETWRKRDPIERFERYLERAGLVDEAARGRLRAALEAELLSAIDAVERLPPQNRQSLFDDVYETLPWHLQSQSRELKH